MNRNLWFLVGAQAFFAIGNMMLLPVVPILGLQMSVNGRLSTLPIALNMLTMLVFSIPISVWMGAKGRRPAFLAGMAASGVAAIVLFSAIQTSSFTLLLVGCVCFGIAMSCANYYRFAATELVNVDGYSKAISAVMAVGIVAALVGPNLATLTKGAFFELDFSASVLMLLPLSLVGAFLVLRIRWPLLSEGEEPEAEYPESDLRAVSAVGLSFGPFWRPILTAMLGYGVMVLVMSATPLHMSHHGYDFGDTAWVIQWHVLGMYVPSLFFSRLVLRCGLNGLIIIGTLILIGSLLINVVGDGIIVLTVALLLTGIGWNFMFLGASHWLVNVCSGLKLEKEVIAKIQGINEVCVFGFAGLGAFSSGWLIDSVGWNAVNVMSLPLLVVLLCILLFDAWFSPRETISLS